MWRPQTNVHVALVLQPFDLLFGRAAFDRVLRVLSDVHGWVGGWMDGWMDGWDGWMGWMDGQMSAWVEGYVVCGGVSICRC